jgi:hypothetical protein
MPHVKPTVRRHRTLSKLDRRTRPSRGGERPQGPVRLKESRPARVLAAQRSVLETGLRDPVLVYPEVKQVRPVTQKYMSV